MLTHIKGILEEAEINQIVVDVNGIGYVIAIPATTFDRLPRPGVEVKIYVHPVIRDDEHLLFGFHSKDERQLFRLLISVNGVGPAIGVAMLSALPVSSLCDCIQSGDTKLLGKIKGIGKKTSERIVLELKDKVGQLGFVSAVTAVKGAAAPMADDAVLALEALGFKGEAVRKAVKAICEEQGDSVSSEQIIKLALGKLNS